MNTLEEIPEAAFSELLEELQKKPLAINNYRKKAGEGRSQSFGVVNRRSLPPDYSRQCWLRPKLYKLLLDFAEKYVKIPYTSITVNQNFQAAPHYDRGNLGNSFLVAFGSYTGGRLALHQAGSAKRDDRTCEGGSEGSLTYLDIRHKPVVGNFSTSLHSVEAFQGQRYSLVFYTLKDCPPLPPPSVSLEEGLWQFKRGEEVVKNGLPHPLKRGFRKEDRLVEVTFG